MRSRGAGEEGMALLVVMVLMGVMLTAGFAIASTVDTQTSASRSERVRDSAFNLAESALNAQVFRLSDPWPGVGSTGLSGAPLPYGTCTQTSTSSQCPDNASLRSGSSGDLTNATWETTVRDNGPGTTPSSFYSDQSTALQPGYDANNDGKVWVRAEAVAEGHRRTLVALAGVEQQAEDLPHVALIAGRLDIANEGNKVIINANGGQVAVRCTPSLVELTPCLGQKLGGKYTSISDLSRTLTTQIAGTTPQYNYPAPPAMSVEARLREKARAVADGTFYATCPPAAKLTGHVVYVESGTCDYSSNGIVANSPTAPGLLVLERGSVAFGGTTAFYGIVYAANTTNASGALVRTYGNGAVSGGVLIDGPATFAAAAIGLNVGFDLNAFRAVASYGSAGVIQNTWREVRAG